MKYDLQKADIWKRASAGLLDLILTATLAVGLIWLIISLTGFDGHHDSFFEIWNGYAGEESVEFNPLTDNFANLSEEDQAKVDAAWAKFSYDPQANKDFNMMIALGTLSITLGILLAFIVTEFVIPMIFKNGQTVGKKVFGIGVMRVDGVRVTGLMMFVRSILGKYTIETMVPLIMLIWIMVPIFNAGVFSVLVLALVVIGNLVMMVITDTNSGIHDLFAHTVTVDMSSQMIFDSPEALLEYKQKIHAEAVERAEY